MSGARAWSRLGMARIDAAVLVVTIATSVLFVVLLARVIQLQLRPGAELGDHIRLRQSGRSVDAPRGRLLDRRGRVLASSRVVFRVVCDPTLLPGEPGEVVVKLAGVLGLGEDELGLRLIDAQMSNDAIRQRRAELGLDEPGEQRDRTVGELLQSKFGIAGKRTETAVPAADGAITHPRPRRYLVLSGEIEQETADRVRALRLRGVSLERREHRAYTGGDIVASIVGKTGPDDLESAADGWLGIEKTFDDRLDGGDGSLSYVRDAWGRPLWVQRGAWIDPVSGDDLRLSIDLEIQRIAVDQLRRGIEDAEAAGGRIVVADPRTGEVLAMGDLIRPVPDAVPYPWRVKSEATGAWTHPHGELPADPRDRPRYITLAGDPGRLVHPALGRNRCVEDVYEPGSTFKPFVWSRAKQLGLLPDDEVLTQEKNLHRTPYGRTLRDVTFRGELSWDEVLLYSSNIGMAQAAERLTQEQMRGAITRLGFGRRTDLSLPGESPGIVTNAKDWTVYSQTSVAMGHEVAVTPVQMVRAFSVFARGGSLAGTMPRLRLTAAGAGRPGMTGEPLSAERVLEPRIAARTRDALVGVADRLDKKNAWRFPDEPEPAYKMFGKSGTAEIPSTPPPGARRPRGTRGYFDNQYNSSFIAAAPAEHPRIVVIVVIDDPGPALVRRREHYGSWVAGPVVRRVVEDTLKYLSVVPKASIDEEQMASASQP